MNPQGLKSLSLLLALCCLCLFIAGINANSEPVQWPVNGHWYDAIDYPSTWIRAYIHAKRQSHEGLPGHLATLTSQEENDFVWQTFQRELYWLGGFQVRWARRVDRGWRWITGERWWRFTNWDDTQPDDGGDMVENGEENFLQFRYHESNGKWNDIWTTSQQPGYMIEYEEMPDQALAPIKLKDIHQLTTTWAILKQAH
ncbi:TPA: hypothetical protein EYP66_21545 [Candidatus Poribacteria bacterium]|nr:hypothetical protein [Candidatus Poribacteria bacterium]